MRAIRTGAVAAMLGLVSLTGGAASHSDLTFDRRVAAQEAIERVYYAHQVGAARPFEQAVGREVIENKVRTYLEQSAALERLWGTPVTEEALRAELDRIAARTRLPERLREIYAALGNDPSVILETFARASLVDRLSRSFFQADERVKGRTWDEWLASARVGFDAAGAAAATAAAGESVELPLPALAASCGADDTWSAGALDDMPDGRTDHVTVWTGSLMIVWGGMNGNTALASGGRYDPLTDTWTPTSTAGAPSPRGAPTAVWTGSEMIVWGGRAGTAGLNTGGRYDPTSDAWIPTSTVGAPAERLGHTAVWTGSEMIVWGGRPTYTEWFCLVDGARYDPVSDIWSPISTLSVPEGRSDHTAVWTGGEMIVWGGRGFGPSYPPSLNGGGIYSPATDSWRPTALSGAPTPRYAHTTIWTGTEMIVWGGRSRPTCCDVLTNTGGRYDPITNSWTPMSPAGAPEARQYHSAVWTGSRMIVWGGTSLMELLWGPKGLQTGGRYDPSTDTWSPTSLTNAPLPRLWHGAVWTGSLMIVWGGAMEFRGTTSWGGRYDPVSDNWTPTANSAGGPDPVILPQAVWTGNEMIVWGASAVCAPYCPATGGRYDPLLDRWRSISGVNAPAARFYHSVAWTGSEMIVWGGEISNASGTDGGGRYDPISDTWAAISSYGAPSVRYGALSVWTGRELIVWSGMGAGNTGGRYDPALDTWTATETAGAPDGRWWATAVWTGREMIVWGGYGASGAYLGSGGRYDPAADRWSPTSPLDDRYFGRISHTAVWTGRQMIIWGGEGRYETYPPGIAYDPDGDRWGYIGSSGEPSPRAGQSALWTGSHMVVWGGSRWTSVRLNTGGIYDPATDSWAAMSTRDGPTARGQHAAVWTGSAMIVWGGYNGGTLSSGSRYAMEQSVDNDGDGFSECAGDCNDSNAAVYPGAPQVCGDGLNNDCRDPGWPALAGTNDADGDGDGFSECAGDCNDSNARVSPAAVELPGNTTDENCDGSPGPCDPSAAWKNHGQFVACVARECGRLVGAGSVSRRQCDALVVQAARTNVGMAPRLQRR